MARYECRWGGEMRVQIGREGGEIRVPMSRRDASADGEGGVARCECRCVCGVGRARVAERGRWARVVALDRGAVWHSSYVVRGGAHQCERACHNYKIGIQFLT